MFVLVAKMLARPPQDIGSDVSNLKPVGTFSRVKAMGINDEELFHILLRIHKIK
jgi:hypothetical protein